MKLNQCQLQRLLAEEEALAQMDVAIDACDAKDSAKAITELKKFFVILAKVPAN